MEPELHNKMDELVFWAKLMGVVGVPLLFLFIGWIWVAERRLHHMKDVGDELLDMHKNPADTGFGTVGMQDVIKANTRALRELSHYIRWSIKRDGGEAEPFVDEGELR